MGVVLAISACSSLSALDDAPATRAASDAPLITAPTPAHEIVMIGDSVMSGYGLDDGTNWPAILADRSGEDIVNLACPGAGFTSIGDCDDDFAGIAAEAITLDPATVIIQSSDNDFGSDPDELDRTTLDTVRLLHAALPHTQIVGLSTVRYITEGSEDELAATAGALSDAIADVGGTYVDVGQPLAGQPDLVQDDEEHPTEDGQVALARAMQSALEDAGVIPGIDRQRIIAGFTRL